MLNATFLHYQIYVDDLISSINHLRKDEGNIHVGYRNGKSGSCEGTPQEFWSLTIFSSNVKKVGTSSFLSKKYIRVQKVMWS